MATLRDMCIALAPSWLQTGVGGALLRSVGTVLDGLVARTNEGVKLRMPGIASPTALGYIGNDRNIERGPSQPDTPYALQLSKAFDTWRNAGGARTILGQLRYYFAPDDGPPMRAVSNSAVWHEIDPVTGIVTKTVDGTNWNWDDLTRWWRGWIIIDGTDRWLIDHWDDGGTWGDGGVWGSNMTEADARSFKRIIKKWKPANVYAKPIITFDPDLFEVTDVLADNVDGTGEDPFWRVTLQANFFESQGT